MVDLSFSLMDLEYFLLIFVRVSCFVFIAPFFSMQNTPRTVRIAISFFTAMLLYTVLTPSAGVVYDSVVSYAVIVAKEALTGLLIGFAANICTAIVNFAGSVVDMETGLSMVTLLDPATREHHLRRSVSVRHYDDADCQRYVPVSFRCPGRLIFTYSRKRRRYPE